MLVHKSPKELCIIGAVWDFWDLKKKSDLT